MAMAAGNVLFGTLSYLQEFKKLDCIRNAIYHNATEPEFTNCLLASGFFENGTTWILAEFILIVVSLVIGSFVEGSMKKKETLATKSEPEIANNPTHPSPTSIPIKTENGITYYSDGKKSDSHGAYWY